MSDINFIELIMGGIAMVMAIASIIISTITMVKRSKREKRNK